MYLKGRATEKKKRRERKNELIPALNHYPNTCIKWAGPGQRVENSVWVTKWVQRDPST